MCEQTEVNYLDGDVVWVKLGPSWWPGEVLDLSKVAPEIVKSFRKSPIAVVKFFQEDKYEYVKNINHIYKYNCRRKHEFIKKGLDMHRAKNAFMDKFPADVCHAENLTNGDPDIITNDEFAPEKKANYSQIFGTPTNKSKSGTGVRGRRSLGTPKSAGARLSSTPRITHPRFLGKSDYEMRILEQSTPQPPPSHYTCHICGFESSRLNVIVLHNRSHSNGTYVSPPKSKSKKNKSPKNSKRPKSFATTNSIDEDLELIRQGFTITTEETSGSDVEVDKDSKDSKEKKKGGAKPAKRKGNTKTAVISASKKAKVSSICNNLLADWGDDDSSEEQEKTEEKPPAETTTDLLKTPEKTQTTPEKTETETTPEKSSCFDFEDEEETKEEVLEKSPGRKIPRVIPPKRISKDTDDPEPPEPSADAENNPETPNDKSKESSKRDLEAFEKFLQETTVPDFSQLSDLSPGKKKPDDATDKTNGMLKKDEPEEPQKDTKEAEPTITQIPKKRFVRNFEEFETFMNDSRTPSSEESEDTTTTTTTTDASPSKSTLEVSKLKSQLMSKLNDSPTKDEEESPKEKFFLRKKKSNETLKPDRRKKKLLKDFDEPEAEKAKEPPPQPEEKEKEEEKDEVNETVLEENKTEPEIEEDNNKSEDSKNLMKEPEVEAASDVPELQENSHKEEEKDDIVANLDETPPIIEEETRPNIEEIPLNMDETSSTKETSFNMEETPSNMEETPSNIEEEIPSNMKETSVTPVVEETPDVIDEEEKSKAAVEQETPTINEETPIVMEETSIVEPEQKPTIIEEPPIIEETSTIDEQPPIIEETPVVVEEPSIVEEPPIVEETPPPVDSIVEQVPIVEEIPIEETPQKEDSRSEKMLADISDICIDNSDNLSGLSTLAAVSELSGNLYDKLPTPETKEEPPIITEEEIFQPEPEPEQQKPIQTLANFSMDFSDSNSESTIIKTIVNEEKIEPKEVEEDFETIEKEINLIDSDKLNSFPENISQPEAEVEPEPEQQELDVNYQEFTITEEAPTNDTNTEATLESEIAKLTDTQPGAEGVVQEHHQNTSSSKLLEILTDAPNKRAEKLIRETPRSLISGQSQKVQMVISGDSKSAKKFDPKTSKFIIKSSKIPGMSQMKSNKPIILSEKIIKPVTEMDNVSVKKVTSKRTYQDVEDIDTFIIQKPTKKSNSGEMDQQDIILAPKTDTLQKYRSTLNRPRGKPKIIEQTIIKAADPQPPNNETQESPFDDNMFDINSMPIVLSDQILTPESIENMPVVMQNLIPTSSVQEKPQTIITKRGGAIQKQQIKLVNKEKVNLSSTSHETKVQQNVLVKNIIPRGLAKNQKVYQTGSKILKNNPAVITQPGKPGKFIILPSSTASTTPTGSKYTVGKRTTVKTVQQQQNPTTSKLLKNEPTGNKIMIVTNQHGVQSRVLLTPAQQKLLGCKMPTTKIKSPTTTTTNKLVQKSILTSKGTLIAPSNSGIKTTAALASQTIVTSKGQVYTTTTAQPYVTSEGQVLTPLSQQQLKTMKNEQQQKFGNKKIQTQRVLLSEKPDMKNKMLLSPKTKTILIKGSQGQTIKKIQTSTGETKNVLLSGGNKSLMQMAGKQILVNSKGQFIKTSDKLPIPKQQPPPQLQEKQKMSPKTPRIVSKGRQVILHQKQSPALPPLAPITAAQRKEMPLPAKLEQKPQKKDVVMVEPEQKQPNQLVIQDALGNQTTVTEGQILALPSGEVVDGQPQSYVLVTVDEAGNLVPISNDTLMSLDPNLGQGGDMNNIVLQIDQQDKTPVQQELMVDNMMLQEPPEFHPEENQAISELPLIQEQQQTAVAINNGDSSQQLIITGDPESTQKFLASLSEGNTDLSSLLSGTDGNIIINTDGQQILLNTDSENQILLSVNPDNMIQTSEPEPTNQFVSQQLIKNQDILAAALADTDVFQQESQADKTKPTQSQLSPSLYPMNVSTLETSLTLGSPIMTPLEVPSVKKITSDELITQVPSSLELPITITDPSISQVSQQLQTNLELPISMSETITSISSSPNFVYSLPALDDSAEKFPETSTVMTSDYNTALTGSMSMPLLTEEPETPVEQEQEQISAVEPPKELVTSEPNLTTNDSTANSELTSITEKEEPTQTTAEEESETKELHIGPIEEELDLNNSDICSSLSEPPPGMFDKSFLIDDDKTENVDVEEPVNSLLNNVVAETETAERLALSETPNSELNSPRLDIDENSQEIPIQPQIVATFDENSSELLDKKRAADDDDVDDDSDNKRSKLSCD